MTLAGSPSALEVFQAHRPRLFGIAYRMLGSATDAEDVLQDAWLRWQGIDRAGVADPGAYLARTVTNLCLNAHACGTTTFEQHLAVRYGAVRFTRPEPRCDVPAGASSLST